MFVVRLAKTLLTKMARAYMYDITVCHASVPIPLFECNQNQNLDLSIILVALKDVN